MQILTRHYPINTIFINRLRYFQGGLPSLNFKGVTWWQLSVDGRVLDPYKLLVGELGTEGEKAEKINQGGAASNAYLRLQFEDLQSEARNSLRKGLLRYCELDTLAMVFVLQSWFHG